MHNIKYYIISLAALLIILAAIVNIKETDVKKTGTETKSVPQDVTQTINFIVDPAVSVASNMRLGLNLSQASHRDDLVGMLKEINPSYLRDEQLLSSNGSISEFLDLCVRVGANPWIVIPSNTEMELVDLLVFHFKNKGANFSNAIVELGNEEKNTIFSYEQTSYFDASPYLAEAEENTTHLSLAKRLVQNEELSIDSMNLPVDFGAELTFDPAPNKAKAVFGSVLAKIVLDLLPYKPNPLMILSPTHNQSRWDPTGLAAIMLNQVIGGSLHNLNLASTQNELSSRLTLAAFRTADHWSAAIVSANSKPVNVTIQFPDDGLHVPSSINVLQYANSYLDTNESIENVRIVNQPVQANQGNVTITVPAYGFAVLLGSSQLRG